MFHNISNPKWFGNWSRLEDDYLGNGGTDIADNFTFSKMEKTGGLFGSIIRLATAFPACDPETGHATGAWKVACESIDLDEVPLSDITDELSPELAIADRAERNYLMALVGFLVEWCPRKDLSLESLAVLLSLAEARENDENFKSALDLMFVQIEKGKTYSYVAEYHQYLWVPSTFKRNSDGVKPADCGGLFADEDFALLCWDSVNHLPAIRRISLKASLTSRLIDFKYLREAEAPAYTHGVSNDTFDYEFDDDDDDIPAFSVPEA